MAERASPNSCYQSKQFPGIHSPAQAVEGLDLRSFVKMVRGAAVEIPDAVEQDRKLVHVKQMALFERGESPVACISSSSKTRGST